MFGIYCNSNVYFKESINRSWSKILKINQLDVAAKKNNKPRQNIAIIKFHVRSEVCSCILR